jgi:class 3 adenylate cyclase
VSVACASCGAEQPPDAQFCSSCGASLRQTCGSCGAVELATASFCSSCGATLRDTARRGTAGDEREERRIVSVLFADLAGSTALGELLDPEDVRVLQGELFELVNGAVERFGGVSEKFVGDAVMTVFGIPQAHEDDPERAVRAALAARDAFPAFAATVAERFGADVGLRVGVNTGEVVAGREAAARGELMVSGDVVNVAARLQQAAEPGEVVVGERTYTATSRLVEYAARPDVTAKGKRNPVGAWLAVDLAASPARRGVEGLNAPIVGRDEELAVLAAVVSRVEREHAPQLVTLYGHAGVGKSRLLAELVARLPDTRLLKGRCLPYGDGVTYWPLAEVAKAHAGILDTDSIAVAGAKLRAAVESVVPETDAPRVFDVIAATIGATSSTASRAESSDSEIRARLYSEWSRYVAALGRERTTVLAIEDIHWASEPLLDLLDHLADGLEETRVLIVCPSRPELLDTRPGWGAGKQNAVALTLSPLSATDSRRLVSELLDADRLLEDAREQILDRAEGNPFYLEEILRMLIDEGALASRDGGWVATERLREIRIPDSVHGVIAARVDLLDAQTRDALRRCSVMGRTFWPAAVGVDETLVEGLSRRGLVSERPTSVVAGMREFTFKHALTHDVAYQTLPRAERRTLHRDVGEWVERSVSHGAGETAEIAAYHYGQAIEYGDGDPALAARAFELLLAAADAAVSRAALASAGRLLARAEALAPDDGCRVRSLIALARYDVARLSYEEAVARLQAARSLAARVGDPLLEADVLAWLNRMCWLAGRWDEAVAAADEGVQLLAGLPESPQFARALARRSQLDMLRGNADGESHAEEAILVARRVGDAFAEVNARINLSTIRASRGIEPDPDEIQSMLDAALGSGHWDEAYRGVINYIWSAASYVAIPDLEAAVAAGADRLAGGHGIEFDSYAKYLALSRARFLWIPSGRWDRIEDELDAPGIAAAGGSRLVLLEILAGMAVRRGDLATADRLLPEFIADAIASREPQRIVPMAGVVLPRAALAGDGETVRAVTETLLTAFDGRLQLTTIASAAIPRALFQAGEFALLRRLDEVMLHEATMGRCARAVQLAGSGLLALSAGDAGTALSLLREAVEIEHQRGAHYAAACAELDLALAYEAVGDGSGAAEARGKARAFLEPLGCVNPI